MNAPRLLALLAAVALCGCGIDLDESAGAAQRDELTGSRGGVADDSTHRLLVPVELTPTRRDGPAPLSPAAVITGEQAPLLELDFSGGVVSARLTAPAFVDHHLASPEHLRGGCGCHH